MQLKQWLAWIGERHPKEVCLGLDRLSVVADRLRLSGRPGTVITVAGTNGKGTMCHLLSTALRAHGFRCATYTSPVLFDFCDRLLIDGKSLPEQAWCEAFEQLRVVSEDVPLTFFEYVTLAAWLLLQDQDCDVWVMEIGLGGRLDAVNLIDPDIAVVTHIDLDHQEVLGETREAIAREKLGIVRTEKPLIFNEDEPTPELLALAENSPAEPTLVLGRDYTVESVGEGIRFTGPAGRWNLVLNVNWNPAAVAGACTVLQQVDSSARWDMDKLEAAWSEPLEGRCQLLSKHCPVWVDVAHNAHACLRLAEALQANPVEGRTHAIFACRGDKAFADMLAILAPHIDRFHLPAVEDAYNMRDPAEVQGEIARLCPEVPCDLYSDYTQAWYAVEAGTGPKDRIVVFGSFYMAGPLYHHHLKR